MKKALLLICTIVCLRGQSQAQAKNMVIFLMDGYRWRELFQGADSLLIFNKRYTRGDSAWTVTKYWDQDPTVRRRKLMPFVWGTIVQHGQLLGNRDLGNKVNVQNKFWFSYPGRSESFTGYYDSAVNSNEYPDNPNINVMEFIDQQPGFHGKVVTFASWDAVARILNRDRNGMLVNIYGEDIQNATPQEQEANIAQHLMPDIFGKDERLDAGTYLLAKAYLLAHHPRVLYIDLGDTDDFGHAGEYGNYLDAAHHADAMMAEIWAILQADPFYKDQTDLVVFPDHGRGTGPGWTSHGAHFPHSDETYFMAMGPGIAAIGEVKTAGQILQAQYAQTIAALLGFHFTAPHPVAEPIQMNGMNK